VSGLAQAAWLGGGVWQVPTGLRFGVGAWPAIAAAVVAHLLFLLGTNRSESAASPVGQPVQPTLNTLDTWLNSPSNHIQPQPPIRLLHAVPAAPAKPDADLPATVGPRERAMVVGREHLDRIGRLPSVSELADAAEVSRGTAATALRHLRAKPDRTRSVTDHPTEGLDR
jgi:hypothetical protein